MQGTKRHHRLSLLPTSRLGKWSVLAAILSVGGLMIVLAAMGLDQRPAVLVIAHPLTSAIAGVACLVMESAAVMRHHERSVLMLPVLLWGLLVTSVIIAELTYPH